MPRVVPELQVSGLGAWPLARWPASAREGVEQLRRLCRDDAHWRRHAAFGVLNDADLVRFLLARGGDLGKAASMLQRALAWRTKRMPYWLLLDPGSDVARTFQREAQTGKLIATGQDRFGRGVLLMDNACQNTTDPHAQMRSLAYNVQAARDNCAPGVDKICVVINMEDFSVRNSLAKQVIMETIEILTIVYPETLGTCVLWQPPKYAYGLFSVFKPFIDERTHKKLVWVCGDAPRGSENDRLMAEVVGEQWRDITRLTEPRLERGYSEHHRREIKSARGFVFADYWRDVLRRDATRAARAGGPPWPWQSSHVLDREVWDGAYSGFWTANLVCSSPIKASAGEPSRGGNEDMSDFCFSMPDESDVECQSEVYATPPQSDSERSELVSEPSPEPRANMIGNSAGNTYARVAGAVPARVVVVAEPPDQARAAVGAAVGTAAGFGPKLSAATSSVNAVWCIGQLSLLISGIFAVGSLFTIADGPVVLVLTLLDISFVTVGLALIRNADAVPHSCDYLGLDLPQSCVPWGLLLLRCFSTPEAIRAFVRGVREDGVADLVVATLAFELCDALLTVAFALMWAWRLAKGPFPATYGRPGSFEVDA